MKSRNLQYKHDFQVSLGVQKCCSKAYDLISLAWEWDPVIDGDTPTPIPRTSKKEGHTSKAKAFLLFFMTLLGELYNIY